MTDIMTSQNINLSSWDTLYKCEGSGCVWYIIVVTSAWCSDLLRNCLHSSEIRPSEGEWLPFRHCTERFWTVKPVLKTVPLGCLLLGPERGPVDVDDSQIKS
jgi:hypothetical protein